MNDENFIPISESQFDRQWSIFKNIDYSKTEFVLMAIIGGGFSLKELNKIKICNFCNLLEICKYNSKSFMSIMFPAYRACVEIKSNVCLDYLYREYFQYGVNELYYFRRKYEADFLDNIRKNVDCKYTDLYRSIFNDESSIIMKFYIEDDFDAGAAVSFLKVGNIYEVDI